MPRSLLIVLHGKQAGNQAVRQAVAALRAAGHCVLVRVTWEAGDAARIVREAVSLNVDTVVAGGGDGTINEVTQALVTAAIGGSAPALGILPLGTANDFAHSTGVPLDPAAALRLIVNSAATPIDVGRIGERVFLNVATGGFGVRITVETPEALKRVLGGAAYFITGIRKFDSIRSATGSLRAPGFDWNGNFLVLAIGNGRQAGGGHVLCPEARLNDRLLDVGILPDVLPNDVPDVLSTLLRDGFTSAESIVVRAKTPWLEIHSDSPLHLNLDGEPIAATHIRIETLPGAVRVHLPPSDLLV